MIRYSALIAFSALFSGSSAGIISTEETVELMQVLDDSEPLKWGNGCNHDFPVPGLANLQHLCFASEFHAKIGATDCKAWCLADSINLFNVEPFGDNCGPMESQVCVSAICAPGTCQPGFQCYLETETDLVWGTPACAACPVPSWEPVLQKRDGVEPTPVHPIFKYQWQVMLLQRGRAACEGSLISSTRVLTAANCIANIGLVEQLEVAFFRHFAFDGNNVDSLNQCERRVPVYRTHIHPNYNAGTNEGNIAIIELMMEAPTNDYLVLDALSEFMFDNTTTLDIAGSGSLQVSQFGSNDEIIVESVYLKEVSLNVTDCPLGTTGMCASRIHLKADGHLDKVGATLFKKCEGFGCKSTAVGVVYLIDEVTFYFPVYYAMSWIGYVLSVVTFEGDTDPCSDVTCSSDSPQCFSEYIFDEQNYFAPPEEVTLCAYCPYVPPYPPPELMTSGSIMEEIARERKQEKETRIINGEDVPAWTYEFMVTFSLEDDKTPNCGATVMSPYHVLTTAHCVQTLIQKRQSGFSSPIVINFYQHFRETHNKKKNPCLFSREVVSFTAHPNYIVTMTNGHDIAILEIKDAVIIPPTILPQLPRDPNDYLDMPLTMVGFGLTYKGLGPSVQMQRTSVLTGQKGSRVKKVMCGKWEMAPDQICVGVDGVRPTGGCYGDSGSPVFLERTQNTPFILYGLVASGDPMCQGNTVMTSITYHRSWISEIIIRRMNVLDQFATGAGGWCPYGSQCGPFGNMWCSEDNRCEDPCDGHCGASSACTLDGHCESIVPLPAEKHCCEPAVTAGCEHDGYALCVCAFDEFCCTTAWDHQCVKESQERCENSCVDIAGLGQSNTGIGLGSTVGLVLQS